MRLLWTEKPPVPIHFTITTWTSVTETERDALRELARGREVLEIGSAFGFSTAAMASVAQHVWAVDPHTAEAGYGFTPPVPGFEGSYPAFERLLSRLDLTCRVDTCFDYSHHCLERGSPLSQHLAGRVSMAFIDANHSFGACSADLTNCERILGPGGVIACHDYGEDTNPEVALAVDAWRQDRPMRLVDTLAIIEL